MSYLENKFFLLAITFGIYFFAKLLQKKTGIVLLNPILLAIAAIRITSYNVCYTKLLRVKKLNWNWVSYEKGIFPLRRASGVTCH